mmetsp:Transcript_11441/g.41859  ORF Transcript_11441/g.41859 Transcript_11441/m.41859 type:complete len:238 (+) Transcript_11441:1345-2058(+)
MGGPPGGAHRSREYTCARRADRRAQGLQHRLPRRHRCRRGGATSAQRRSLAAVWPHRRGARRWRCRTRAGFRRRGQGRRGRGGQPVGGARAGAGRGRGGERRRLPRACRVRPGVAGPRAAGRRSAHEHHPGGHVAARGRLAGAVGTAGRLRAGVRRHLQPPRDPAARRRAARGLRGGERPGHVHRAGGGAVRALLRGTSGAGGRHAGGDARAPGAGRQQGRGAGRGGVTEAPSTVAS